MDGSPLALGRPKTTGTGQLVALRLHKPMLAALDAYIAEQPDKVSRPEAVRRILAKTLT